ncbi:hypothetical protein ACFWRZ_34330 [Streptomyces rubiginosohelvolus]|uniref:hypothetical protein n=1 Tax=Streptomyces TaxID=1883 RepID=UPI0030D27249
MRHLLRIVERHLFLEHYWRRTGGHADGEWIVEDAPHGLPEDRDWFQDRFLSTTAQAGSWSWVQTTSLIVHVIALLGVYVTYTLNQRASRRERRAKTFAEALTAVEEYLEMPYRIRRRPNSPDARRELTDQVSSLLARMAFHCAWLQIEASAVAEPYAALVSAARSEAGMHASEAWRQPPIQSDDGMNLGQAHARDQSAAARAVCIEAMKSIL